MSEIGTPDFLESSPADLRCRLRQIERRIAHLSAEARDLEEAAGEIRRALQNAERESGSQERGSVRA